MLEADRLVQAIVDEALARAPTVARYAEKLRSEAAIRLVDTIDHLAVGYDDPAPARAGWALDGVRAWRHPAGRPLIVERPFAGVAFRVERLERLAECLGIDAPIEGAQAAPFRRLQLPAEDHFTLAFIERNGAVAPGAAAAASVRRVRRALIHRQAFRTRRRCFRSAEHGLSHTERLVDAAVADLGAAWTSHLFFNAEREYWLSHCEAGARQKIRQDRVGAGWCTIEHLAYQASRPLVHRTLAVFGKLGFRSAQQMRVERTRRPGAAVVLRPTTGAQPFVVIEVDAVSDEDLMGGAPLAPLTWHGDAGLSCALHGEPLLDGGPARVALSCDVAAFAALERADGVAFVLAGEEGSACGSSVDSPRPVNPTRVEVLERDGYVTRREAERLRLFGAPPAQLLAIERAPGCSDTVLLERNLGVFAPSDAPGADFEPFVRSAPMRMRRRRR